MAHTFQDINYTSENIIEFSGNTDPNTIGTVFSPVQPQDNDVLYYNTTTNTYWKWNGSSYVQQQGNSNDFFRSNNGASLPDGTTDPTEAIGRLGNTGIGYYDPLKQLEVKNETLFSSTQTATTSAIYQHRAWWTEARDTQWCIAQSMYSPVNSANGFTHAYNLMSFQGIENGVISDILNIYAGANRVSIGVGKERLAGNKLEISGDNGNTITGYKNTGLRFDGDLNATKFITDGNGDLYARTRAIVTAKNNSGQVISSGAAVKVTNWTEYKDTTNSFNPITGDFVAPITGDYLVNVSFCLANTSWNIGVEYAAKILLNGAEYASQSVFPLAIATTFRPTGTLSTVVTCNAGDVISGGVFQETGANRTLHNSLQFNTLSIVEQ